MFQVELFVFQTAYVIFDTLPTQNTLTPLKNKTKQNKNKRQSNHTQLPTKHNISKATQRRRHRKRKQKQKQKQDKTKNKTKQKYRKFTRHGCLNPCYSKCPPQMALLIKYCFMICNGYIAYTCYTTENSHANETSVVKKILNITFSINQTT